MQFELVFFPNRSKEDAPKKESEYLDDSTIHH
jgi:hypothetical protein